MPQIVTLSFYRFSGPFARVWALVMMGGARWPLSRTADIGFWKLCGSGTGEGFTPVPNTAVYAILATWPDIATAQARSKSGIFTRYQKRAAEHWTVFLQPQTARGQWAGQTPFTPSAAQSSGPLAALTRATIKPSILARFWGRVPNISAKIGSDTNVMFKIGIGEVPMLHQVTFSIWPSEAAMAAFARTGPHAEAIRAVRAEGWFREELYARFAVHSDAGTWGGISPLTKMTEAA
jgi:spheroidene monooxygenase